jgi:hypothetical protein
MDNNVLEVLEEFQKIKAPYGKEEVALAFWASVAGHEDTPRVLLFKGETPKAVAEKLTRMMRTQTGKTENQLPDMARYIKGLNTVLGRQGHSGASAGWVTLKVIAEALNTYDWRIYVDEGRAYIQYSDAITKALAEQFGNAWMEKARKEEPKFFDFLRAMERTAEEIDGHVEEVNPGTLAKGIFEKKIRRVTFGGFGTIEKEVEALGESIRWNNAFALTRRSADTLIMPGFLKHDTIAGGMLVDSAREFVEGSALHIEVIGDGFGDTSYNMAVAAYERAKKLGIPIYAFVKKSRKANHPIWAEKFLKLVDPKNVRTYERPYEAVTEFEGIYQITFTGIPTYPEKHAEWREKRAALIAQTFGQTELPKLRKGEPEKVKMKVGE